MSTPGGSNLRRAANARNARRSTGPRTAEGKRRASGNARRHGLSASASEDPDAEALLARISADWPEDFVREHANLIQALASTQARLNRAGALGAAAVLNVAAQANTFGDESAARDGHLRAAQRCRDMALDARDFPIERYSADDFHFMASIFRRAANFEPACARALDGLRKLARHTRDGEALRRKLIKALAEAARDTAP